MSSIAHLCWLGQSPTVVFITLVFTILAPLCSQAWTCENSCAGIPIQYPFGSGWDCASPSFQPYVNCSHGKLLFYTPTGTYTVQSIDYINNVMIVLDPQMSTCNAMQLSGAFGLPIGSPFSFASYDTVALIGCSSTSSLFSKQVCDTTMQQVCDSLYGCSSIKQLGITPNSPSSSCCVLSSSVLAAYAPYEIDLPLMQCASYSSIYHIGNMQDPEGSWLYGIALRFNPGSPPSPPSSSTGQYPTCYVCQEAEASQAFRLAVPSMLTAFMWAAGLVTFIMEVALQGTMKQE